MKTSGSVWPCFLFQIFFSSLLIQVFAGTTCNSANGVNTFNPDCTASNLPYCQQTIPAQNGVPATYECVQCISNCDCSPNNFCSQQPGEIGTCIEFNRYGQFCFPLSNSQIQSASYLDSWKCAMTFTNNGAIQINQAGVCAELECRFCNWRAGGGLSDCSVSAGMGVERACGYPGTQADKHHLGWINGQYYENTDNVWWAVFFFFFLVLLGIQGAILFFTWRGKAGSHESSHGTSSILSLTTLSQRLTKHLTGGSTKNNTTTPTSYDAPPPKTQTATHSTSPTSYDSPPPKQDAPPYEAVENTTELREVVE